MNTPPILKVNELTEETIAAYLQQHPTFFKQHEDILAVMELPRLPTATVSLAERQVTVLRNENQHLQRKLETLVAIAKKNEELNRRIQRLVIALAGATGPDEFLNTLYDTLQNEFHTDAVVVRLFELPPPNLVGRQEFVEYDAQIFALFEKVLESNRPICGRLDPQQTDYLFSTEKIASAVIIPLGTPKPQGVLAMGSQDISRFHADMGTDLLKYMGELVSQLLKTWLQKR